MTVPVVETFTTLAETTTTADPGTAGTTLAVTARDTFPQSGQFRIVVQNSETDKTNREIMLVTGGYGAGAGSFTVTRGDGGTTGVAHATGSYVAQVLTADAQKRWVPSHVIQPRHLKMCAWSYDPFIAESAAAPSAGVAYYWKVMVPETITFTNFHCSVVAAASSQAANVFGAVYDKTGTRRGVTANQATAFQSTGWKSWAFTADAGGLSITGGEDEYAFLAFLVGTQGTTTGTLARHTPNSIAAALNGQLVAGTDPLRHFTNGSALTALPASFTPLSGPVAAALGFFMGAS